MECNSIALTGIQRDCNANMGGIKKVWMVLKTHVPRENVTISDNEISAITFASGSTSLYPFNFRKGAASMTSNLQKDDTAGSYFWQTDLVMNFQRMETSKRTAVMALTLAECAAVVLDANDKYWFLGLDEYLGATAGTGETGQAKTDANQYTVTLQDNSLELPYEILPSAITGSLPVES